MLIQFGVSNYKSIREEVILSALAGSDKAHEDELFGFRKERILPSLAIYGANAAGKSNLFKALAAALIIIRTSNGRQINETIPLIAPFSFDEESKTKPTRFSFIFTTKQSKYEYGFSADSQKVYEEYLYEYKTAKPSKILSGVKPASIPLLHRWKKSFVLMPRKIQITSFFFPPRQHGIVKKQKTHICGLQKALTPSAETDWREWSCLNLKRIQMENCNPLSRKCCKKRISTYPDTISKPVM